VRAEEVSGAGGGEGGGEEAAGARAAAAAAGAQADHRLIRLHASGAENPTRKRIARESIEESASARGEIAEESKVREGGRVPSATSLSGKRGEGKGGVGDGRRWGFIWWS
jgi:hypothetical protein